MVPQEWRIHRHCFTQDIDTAREWLSAFPNMYFGFTPLITRKSKSVAPIRLAAAGIPLDRLLLETDAPYFVPDSVKVNCTQSAMHTKQPLKQTTSDQSTNYTNKQPNYLTNKTIINRSIYIQGVSF